MVVLDADPWLHKFGSWYRSIFSASTVGERQYRVYLGNAADGNAAFVEPSASAATNPIRSP